MLGGQNVRSPPPLKGSPVTTIATSPGISQTASALRRLYFVRFAFAIVWALVTIATVKEIGPLAVALFVLYPLFDVGAAIYDLRSSRTTGSPTLLYVHGGRSGCRGRVRCSRRPAGLGRLGDRRRSGPVDRRCHPSEDGRPVANDHQRRHLGTGWWVLHRRSVRGSPVADQRGWVRHSRRHLLPHRGRPPRPRREGQLT
jgi:hypothetical protein